MKKSAIAAVILAASTTFAFAQTNNDNSLGGAEMPTTHGGKTDMPNAKPTDGSISSKEMKDSPGVTSGGKTDMPNAKPTDGSISSKEMQDAPGAQK
jgi:hypothetical protein